MKNSLAYFYLRLEGKIGTNLEMGQKQTIGATFLFLVLSLFVNAEAPTKDEDIALLRNEVARLKAENAALRLKLPSTSASTPSAYDEVQAAIAKTRKKKIEIAKKKLDFARDQLDSVYSNRRRFESVAARTREVTNLKGLVSVAELDVEQASDPKRDVRINFESPISIGNVAELGEVEIFQISGPHDALCYMQLWNSRELVWVSGINTASFVDGEKYTISGYFKATHTKMYQTTIGTKTVMQIEHIYP